MHYQEMVMSYYVLIIINSFLLLILRLIASLNPIINTYYRFKNPIINTVYLFVWGGESLETYN